MSNPTILSTDELPAGQRQEWLREVIGREYANVEITPPTDERLFNEMTIHPWGNLRLSSIRSNAITIERLPREPDKISQDAYFAVVLLSGDYSLKQDGREVVLRPGDMTIYDATRPHRIFCPGHFSKLILSVPRSGLKERIVGVEHCSALHIPGDHGAGAVTAAFLTSCAKQAGGLSAAQIAGLSENCLDLLAMALSAARPAAAAASRGRVAALTRIKNFVERNLADPNLDASTIAAGVGMSTRYVNDILSDEDVSLMRYVLGRRLEKCQRDLTSPASAGIQITDIAFRWGFNDLSHFSRSFKEKFGCSPREYKKVTLHLTHRVSK
jgi:AraC family transcriptional regulator, positive regulator of tynA and feaB